MTYCGKCGAENPDGNSFCYKCGARLEGSPYRSASDVREIKVERPEPPKAARLEEVPDNGSPYRSFKDVRTRTAAGTNAEVPGEEKTDTVTDYTKVDLPGVRRKVPKSSDHTSVLAVIIVVVVLVVACAAILYYQQSEDSEGECNSFYDLPSNHPLYGHVTPDGEYRYSGYGQYQGQTIDLDVRYVIDDGQILSASINGESVPRSEIEDIMMSDNQYSFDIGSGYFWNDGSRTYLVYEVEYDDGASVFIAENGAEVRITGQSDGVTIFLTLDVWSRGAYSSTDSSGDSLVIGPGNIEMDTTGRAF